MIDPKFFLKLPQDFKGKCKIYAPTANQVVGEDKFPIYKKLLTLSQEEIEDEFVQGNSNVTTFPTPWEFLLSNAYNSKELEELTKEAFYFFTKEEVTFFYELKLILIGNLEERLSEIKNIDNLVFLSEEDFFDFQNSIRESCGEKKIEKPNPNEDPRVKRIKAKARYRDKVKAKRGDGLSTTAILTAICCMGLGITPLNIGEMSYAALLSIFECFQGKEGYEMDIKCLLAGGDSKKIKPKYWIRNLE